MLSESRAGGVLSYRRNETLQSGPGGAAADAEAPELEGGAADAEQQARCSSRGDAFGCRLLRCGWKVLCACSPLT